VFCGLSVTFASPRCHTFENSQLGVAVDILVGIGQVTHVARASRGSKYENPRLVSTVLSFCHQPPAMVSAC